MKRLALTLTLLLCSGAASAQITYSKPLSMACSDRIAITAFELSPYNQLASPRVPLVSDTVTAKLAFKNNCSSGSSLTVPWQIKVNGTVIGSANYCCLAPGASTTVSAQWVASGGVHDFQAVIDPANSLGEDPSVHANNTSPVRRAEVTPFVNEILSYSKAWAAGARFANNTEPGGCDVIDQNDWGSETPPATVRFRIACGFLGGKGEPEAFVGFNLANGWRVLRTESFGQVGCTGPYTGCQAIVLPQRGARSPHIRMRLWSEPLRSAYAFWNIWIEGPQCYSPYVPGQTTC